MRDDPTRAECVSSFMRCIERAAGEPIDRPKAWVHAYLASQGSGDVRVGEGANKGYWQMDSPVLAPVRQFLMDLVEAAAALSRRPT